MKDESLRQMSLVKKKMSQQRRERELNEVLGNPQAKKHHLCEEGEVYVVESHNGMVSQLFRSNKILFSFRSDFVKSQSCKTYLAVARFPPVWCQERETNQMNSGSELV